MDKDKLQSLNELLLAENHDLTKKACTLGLIIDCSGAYKLENGDYMRKVKIIDESLNLDKSSFTFKYCFCTVMFYADTVEALPNPQCIGDIIYLRRFTFEKWNEQFQAKIGIKNISSWALMQGQDKNGFSDYQKSKGDMNLDDEKYNNIRTPLRDLRRFGRKYLQAHSIVKSLSPGVSTKDQDYVVRLVRRSENRSLVLDTGSQNVTLIDCWTYMQEGDIGKLRSVASIRNQDGQHAVCKNNFTSLIKLPQWSFDAQSFIKNDKNIEQEEQDIYTSLNQLLVMTTGIPFYNIADCVNRVYNVKCEIYSISANTFHAAVKHYDPKKNTINDTQKKDTIPVYKLMLLARDSTLPEKKAVELWVFSHDGKCSNFVPKVDLKDLNEYSSMVQEQALFEQRYNDLLEAESVKATVECLADGKGNKMFRVIRI